MLGLWSVRSSWTSNRVQAGIFRAEKDFAGRVAGKPVSPEYGEKSTDRLAASHRSGSDRWTVTAGCHERSDDSSRISPPTRLDDQRRLISRASEASDRRRAVIDDRCVARPDLTTRRLRLRLRRGRRNRRAVVGRRRAEPNCPGSFICPVAATPNQAARRRRRVTRRGSQERETRSWPARHR